MPTLYAPKLGARKTTVLLQKIKNVLEQSGFSTELPHQIPVLAKNKNGVKLLRPIIKNGKLAHTFCRQMDNENIQKYEARIKLKIIAGEMEQLEQRVFEDSFCRNKNSKRLCKEIRILNLDASHFPEWTFFARKLITATALLGRFGSKGHLILKIRREDCQKTATAIAGLMKHGLVYMIGTRLYPIWNIRRPQHGWFQPITVLAENPRIFQRETVKALGSPMYASAQFRALRSLYFNTLTAAKTISLLKSPNPLIFMEAYRSIACRGIKFGDSTIFSRRELKAYAREKESNCNNPRDRKLSLWSLATGRALPLLPKETNQLTKYNCFVQAFTSGGVLDADATSFFHAPHQTSISAVNFMGPYIERVTRLMHEYFIYTLASGLPKEIIYEKRKELFYAYYVQGRVLLEGPRKQATQAKLFLRKLSISEALLDGRILRKTLRWLRHIKTKQRNTEFLLPWLIKQNKLPKQFSDFDAKENIYIKRLLLLSHKHPQHSMNGADV
ncbi:hypothetical protein HY250_03015 [Candidatus Azambacteria bacterium]|nr:hypothetical protein [Candidatus Azambacteria bacterium]